MVEQVHIVSASYAAHPPDWATDSALKALINQVASLKSLYASAYSAQREDSNRQEAHESDLISSLEGFEESRSADAMRQMEEEVTSRRHQATLQQKSDSSDERRTSNVLNAMEGHSKLEREHLSSETDKLKSHMSISGAAQALGAKAISDGLGYIRFMIGNNNEILRQGVNLTNYSMDDITGRLDEQGNIVQQKGVALLGQLSEDLFMSKEDTVEMFMRAGHAIHDAAGGINSFRKQSKQLGKEFLGIGQTTSETTQLFAEYLEKQREMGVLEEFREGQAQELFREQTYAVSKLSQAFGKTAKEIKESGRSQEEEVATRQGAVMALKMFGGDVNRLGQNFTTAADHFRQLGPGMEQVFIETMQRGAASPQFQEMMRHSPEIAQRMLDLRRELAHMSGDDITQLLPRFSQLAAQYEAENRSVSLQIGEGQTAMQKILLFAASRLEMSSDAANLTQNDLQNELAKTQNEIYDQAQYTASLQDRAARALIDSAEGLQTAADGWLAGQEAFNAVIDLWPGLLKMITPDGGYTGTFTAGTLGVLMSSIGSAIGAAINAGVSLYLYKQGMDWATHTFGNRGASAAASAVSTGPPRTDIHGNPMPDKGTGRPPGKPPAKKPRGSLSSWVGGFGAPNVMKGAATLVISGLAMAGIITALYFSFKLYEDIDAVTVAKGLTALGVALAATVLSLSVVAPLVATLTGVLPAFGAVMLALTIVGGAAVAALGAGFMIFGKGLQEVGVGMVMVAAAGERTVNIMDTIAQYAKALNDLKNVVNAFETDNFDEISNFLKEGGSIGYVSTTTKTTGENKNKFSSKTKSSSDPFFSGFFGEPAVQHESESEYDRGTSYTDSVTNSYMGLTSKEAGGAVGFGPSDAATKAQNRLFTSMIRHLSDINENVTKIATKSGKKPVKSQSEDLFPSIRV